MKKIYSLIAALILTANLSAQTPQKMSYQAVIRDNGNILVASAPVGMQISILQGSAAGTAVYVETQTANTNVNGLVSLQIGNGTVVSGTFSGINWAAGPYFIKTETDPTGGSSYTITGTSELLSVPYALFAANGITNHFIGESYGGGIVFYVYDNGQHGLIAAVADQSTGMQWYNGTFRYTGTTGDGLGAGVMDTAMIVAIQAVDNQPFQIPGNFAAKLCADYSVTIGSITYGDWYLPSKYELNLLYLQQAVVGGFTGFYYWSSTEVDNITALTQEFLSGSQSSLVKGGTFSVRAIRSF